jgi:hypothetical protein
VSSVLVSTAWLQRFVVAADVFCSWFDEFDPDSTTLAQVRDRLKAIATFRVVRNGNPPTRPSVRFFKPNQTWQRNQRKARRVALNGYRTGLLPNDDGLPYVLCSLAYDLCDFYEARGFYSSLALEDMSRVPGHLFLWNWDYTTLRINACMEALSHGSPESAVDPFTRLTIGGRQLRFVSWSRSSRTHATSDAESKVDASTLCGGQLAFHKHTNQQWTCYACDDCRRIIDTT